MIDFPTSSYVVQLQRIQGKVKFLQKWIPLHSDNVSQKEFDAMKVVLVWESLIYPFDYQRIYFLYLTTAITTIAMVFVQEDDLGTEHLIYYLSQNLNDT